MKKTNYYEISIISDKRNVYDLNDVEFYEI